MFTTMAVIGLVLAGFISSRISDGPLGPIPGGSLVSGELVDAPVVDWSAVTGGQIEDQITPYFVEFELAERMSSRTTGILLYEGEVYIPCDLGFGWARMSGSTRWILHLIYLVKDWHNQALEDGLVVLRIAGKRYERQAVRVIDPEVVEALRLQLEAFTAEWQTPEPLGPRPTDGPKDIWFFRLDARSTT